MYAYRAGSHRAIVVQLRGDSSKCQVSGGLVGPNWIDSNHNRVARLAQSRVVDSARRPWDNGRRGAGADRLELSDRMSRRCAGLKFLNRTGTPGWSTTPLGHSLQRTSNVALAVSVRYTSLQAKSSNCAALTTALDRPGCAIAMVIRGRSKRA
jgi:hypothetical protein